MTIWHDEIIAGVQEQFKAATEAAELEQKRRKSAAAFWLRAISTVTSFCEAANAKLGKQVFVAAPLEQSNNYACSITYIGPTQRLGGISLDAEQRNIAMTIPGQSQTLTLKTGTESSVIAGHANGNEFTAN